MFQWLNRDKPAPEALELDAKLAQLETLEEQYAEVQTDYATLQNALGAFKQRYWRRVGALYARLDVLRAEIARVRAQSAPRDAQRQAAFRSASSQAEASAQAAREFEGEPGLEEFSPTDELRKFYRMAARIVHPDRAADDKDRSLRDEIMARINVAYRDGYVHTIQSLIDEYQMRARPGADDAATRLIRTIRLISRVREQIAEIGEAVAALRESSLHRLFRAVEEAEARGEDKLRVIEMGIERDIELAERELARLRAREAEAASRAAPATAEPAAQPVTEPAPATPQGGEAQIAALLEELSVSFVWRQPLGEGPGAQVPSFTLRAESGPLLWDHQPHARDEAGRAAGHQRQAWFAAQGFDAGVSLFVTRDEADGSVDGARLRKTAEYIRSLLGAQS